MTKKKINIGFDIGITSVGWAIVDEENKIIDRGVRLFNELKNPKDGKLENQTRREKRHLRRTLRRKRNRKDDFIKLVARKYQDIFNVKNFDNFNELKEHFLNKYIINNLSRMDLILKGLNQEIKPNELLVVLYYYLSHRGYSYISLDQYQKNNDKQKKFHEDIRYISLIKEIELKFSKIKKDNKKEIEEFIKDKKFEYKDDFKTISSFVSALSDYFENRHFYGKKPTEIQKMEFDRLSYLRGNLINTTFSKHGFKDEIKCIFEHQKYLSNSFKEAYLELFERLRDFDKGPGGENSPTEYGLYQKDEEGKIVKKYERLWDKTIGKCSVYIDEDRANKKSFSSEISNLLNQLNTLQIKEEKFNPYLILDDKKKIIFESIAKNKQVTPKFIKTLIGLKNEHSITKYPTTVSKREAKKTSEETSNFDKCDNVKKIFKEIGEKLKISNYDELLKYRELFNNIVDIFARFPTQFNKIEEKLLELFNLDSYKKFNLDLDVVKNLINANLDSQQTSSMSYKALNEYIDNEIIDKGQTVNQRFKSIIDKNENNRFNFENSRSKYINIYCMDDEIMSPTTKCSFRETLKILNKILKRYIYNGDYFLKNIVIEMPTEWNSVDQRKKIKNIQNQQKENKELVKANYSYDGDDKTIINKLVLLYEQDGIDVYTGNVLSSDKVINDASYAQIDHIIPYSYSYDDSWNNKVLVLSSSNQEKKQQTPKEYLGSRFWNLSKKWEEIYLTNDKNKKKYELLTSDINKNNIKVEASFIGRNLADTRYACRLANKAIVSWLETIQKRKDIKLTDDEVNLVNFNGRYVNTFRWEKYLNIPKDRDDFTHHAIDATILAILGNNNEDIGKLVWYRYVDLDTGEVKSKSKYCQDSWKESFAKSKQIPWQQLAESVKDISNVKFSFKLLKKNNIGFWGDTIISVQKTEDEFLENKFIKLLEFDKFSEIDSKIRSINEFYDYGKKYPDPKLYSDLMNAYNEGDKIRRSSKELEQKNPFRLYMEEYCKNNNLNVNEYKSIILKRNNYEYRVSKIKDKPTKINSIVPVKSNIKIEDINIGNRFGAYTGLDWKEIRLFVDSKGKYVGIPMKSDLYNHNLAEVNQEKYQKILKDKNIYNKKYFTIYYGTLIIDKNNPHDLYKIIGCSEKIEIKIVSRSPDSDSKGNSKRIFKSLNKLTEDYIFVTADVLGNLTKVNLDKIFN